MEKNDKKIDIKKFIETLIIVFVVMIGSYAIIENFSYIFSFRYAVRNLDVFDYVSKTVEDFNSKVSKINLMESDVYELEDLKTLKTYFKYVNKDFTEMNNQIYKNRARNIIDWYSYINISTNVNYDTYNDIYDYEIIEILSKYMSKEEYIEYENVFHTIKNASEYNDEIYIEGHYALKYGFSEDFLFRYSKGYFGIKAMNNLADIVLEVGGLND